MTTMKLMGNEEVDYKELLDHLSHDRSQDFESLLSSIVNINLNEEFPGLSQGKTLLYEAILRDSISIIPILFAFSSDVYQWYPKLKKSSLHVAASRGNERIWSLLMSRLVCVGEESKLLVQDGRGQTPLHVLLLRDSNEKLIESCLTLCSHAININNISSVPPLVSALENKNYVRLLLRYNPDISVKVENDLTLREILLSKYPELISDISPERNSKLSSVLFSFSTIWTLIQNNESLRDYESHSIDWNMSNGAYTLCQYAAFLGHAKALNDLLTFSSLDPTLTIDSNPWPPLFIAAKYKHDSLFESLLPHSISVLNSRIESQNIFHSLLHRDHGPWFDRHGGRWDIISRALRILKVLAKTSTLDKNLVNDSDLPNQNTPLHYVTHIPSTQLAKALLTLGAEKSLFYNNIHGWSPVTRLSNTIFNEVLDSKLEFENGINDNDFKILFHIHDLLPCAEKENSPEFEYLIRLRFSHINSFDHPIISSMISIKWKEAYIYYALNDIVTLLFHLTTLSFILVSFGGQSLFDCSRRETSDGRDSLHGNSSTGGNDEYLPHNCCPRKLYQGFRALLGILWLLLTFKKFILLLLHGLRAERRSMYFVNLSQLYFSFESQLLLITLTLIPFLLSSFLDYRTQRDLSGLIIILTCYNLCFLFRNHVGNARRASLLNWMTTVSKSMLEFLALHSALLLGFGLCFYIQLHRDFAEHHDSSTNPFTETFPNVPLKVIAMAIGELELSSFPFIYGQFFNFLTFALFVFLIVIVMLNLLTSVAILDVTEIKNSSTDDAMYALAFKMYVLEDCLHILSSKLSLFKKFVKRIRAFEHMEKTVLCYPNRNSNYSQGSFEIIIRDTSIVEEAKKLIVTKLLRAEEEFVEEFKFSRLSLQDELPPPITIPRSSGYRETSF